MQLVDRMLQRHAGQTIDGDKIDWRQWLKPSDAARLIPGEAIAERCKRNILLGPDAESGLTLPWSGHQRDVLIRPGKLAVWCGWSHHGKSQMLKMLMLHAIHRDEKVVIASMEEDVDQVWEDLARMACGVSNPSVRALDRFIDLIRGRVWLYDQQGEVPAERCVALIRYAAAELGVTQIAIDSLMMIAVNRDDYEAQSNFVGALKIAAKDTGATCHLVAHMRKRDGRTGDDSPGSPHDIAGAHDIASKADYVFNVWRDKKREDATRPSCILGVDKQRGRRNWIGKIGLHFHEPSRQFVEHRDPIDFLGWNREPGSDDE